MAIVGDSANRQSLSATNTMNSPGSGSVLNLVPKPAWEFFASKKTGIATGQPQFKTCYLWASMAESVLVHTSTLLFHNRTNKREAFSSSAMLMPVQSIPPILPPCPRSHATSARPSRANPTVAGPPGPSARPPGRSTGAIPVPVPVP